MGIFRMYTGYDGQSVIEELQLDEPNLRVTQDQHRKFNSNQ